MEKFYSEAEAAELSGKSRQRLHQLRSGRTYYLADGGKKKHKPKMREGRDWRRIGHVIVWTEAGVKRLKEE